MIQRSSSWTGWLIILVPALLIIGLIVREIMRPRPGVGIPTQGNRHLQSVTETHIAYNSKPPTSGPHVGKAPWGVSGSQIPDEVQVHNLEDGGVIVHYDPAQVSTSTMQALESVVQPYYIKGKNIILEPYAGMDSPIVLTAWTRLLKLSVADKIQIEQFINAYLGIDHHVQGQ